MGIKIVSSSDDDDDLNAPETPYNGTSGWSGSDTSAERAVQQDADGTTLNTQNRILDSLRRKGTYGATWKELDVALGINHHGKTTGALSVLHKAGRIARLSDKRNRCKIYVMPYNVAGRDTEKQGR